jgi:tetratricopeptide (TPR) repeat protein
MEAALAIAREAGDKISMSSSLNDLGIVAHEQGDNTSARVLYEESLALKREIGNKCAIAASLLNLGNVVHEQGDYPSARALYEECLALYMQEENTYGVTFALNSLGFMAHEQGDNALASTLYKEGLALSLKIDDKHTIATLLAGLGGAMVGGVQTRRGVRLLGASEHLLQTINAVLDRDDRLPFERNVKQARTLLGDEAFEKAWQEGRGMRLGEAVDYALEED